MFTSLDVVSLHIVYIQIHYHNTHTNIQNIKHGKCMDTVCVASPVSTGTVTQMFTQCETKGRYKPVVQINCTWSHTEEGHISFLCFKYMSQTWPLSRLRVSGTVYFLVLYYSWIYVLCDINNKTPYTVWVKCSVPFQNKAKKPFSHFLK